MTLTVPERIALARKYHADGAIIQNTWERQQDGREMVCTLAAFGPDIRGSEQCPADLMPQWLAYLVPAIDDGIASKDVLWFSGELIERAARWHVLDDAAWERIRTGFLIAGIRQAIEAAAPVQQQPIPDYWQGVVDACEQVCTALHTGVGLEAAARAAWAAESAAARAAWAAALAAESAARAAALAAESAARAAARATAWAAALAAESAARAAARATARAAAWAAESAARAAALAAESAARAAARATARAAAWGVLAKTLFQIIDVEIAATGGVNG